MHYLLWILIGSTLLVSGFIVLIEGGVSHWGYWASGRFPGVVAIVIGIGCFCMVPRALKFEQRESRHGKYLKCSACGKVYQLYKAPDLKCLECKNTLENLEGFFDRHPEFDK